MRITITRMDQSCHYLCARRLKSLVGFAEKNFEALEDKVYFEKGENDSLIRIKTVSGSKKFSAEFDQTVYPLDRGAIFVSCTLKLGRSIKLRHVLQITK